MRIQIDENMCVGHGRCYSVAPDLLTDDEEGFVAERGEPFEVAAEFEDQARDAVGACPEGAIRIFTEAPAHA